MSTISFTSPHLLRRPLIYRGDPQTRGAAFVDVLPVHVHFGNKQLCHKENKQFDKPVRDTQGMIKLLAVEQVRNDLIIHELRRCLADGRHVLLFVSLISHAALLFEMCQKAFAGQDKKIARLRQGDKDEFTNYVYKTPHDICIMTYRLCGVGVSITWADTLFEVSPFKDPRRASQDSGRLRPPREGWTKTTKRRVLLHFVDQFDKFPQMADKCFAIYIKKGYTILPPEEYHSADVKDVSNVVSDCLPMIE